MLLHPVGFLQPRITMRGTTNIKSRRGDAEVSGLVRCYVSSTGKQLATFRSVLKMKTLSRLPDKVL